MCAEGEAECGASGGSASDSPPPLPGFGYAHPAPAPPSPSHSRSYQELRPAHAPLAPHARDMQAYVHLDETLFKQQQQAGAGTDGSYLRGRSPDLSPSPERREDYRQVHYEPYRQVHPPPYEHDHHHHHHVDAG